MSFLRKHWGGLLFIAFNLGAVALDLLDGMAWAAAFNGFVAGLLIAHLADDLWIIQPLFRIARRRAP